MFTPKTTPITLDLTGHKISFDSPVNFSKDFATLFKAHYNINLYDNTLYKDAYNNLNNNYSIGQACWDYGKNIFGHIKGTMSMTMSLYLVDDKETDITNDVIFLSILQSDFEKLYDETSRKKYKITLPKKYEIKNNKNINWGYYESTEKNDIEINYNLRITKKHYIKSNFIFYNVSRHDESIWKPKALSAIDDIIASFKIQ